MLRKVFWEDPYLAHLDTEIAKVDGDAVTLGATIIYAFSGGQESDQGSIGGHAILAARKEGADIVYTLPPGHGLKPGDRVATAIDWEAAGHEIEQRLYAGEFASWRGKAMPKNVKDQFDAKIDAEKKEMDRVRRAEKVPAKQRELKDSLAWVDLLQDAFLAARIDESSQNIELRAKIRTHLGE